MPDPLDKHQSPLNPENESLFGLASNEWQVRLQQAHQSRPLGPFGPYELLAEIGRGSQGEVYRAVQPGTGRIVAIKRIAGLGFAPDPVLLDRFTREVEALTRLSHPNVVTVHALDVVNGHTILVMELVEGRPIDQWADLQWSRAPEPLQILLAVFARVCAGVAHAHQRGVIHRDIKPSNILVTPADQPKVLDFGIARLLGEHAANNAHPTFTLTGFAGTPAYASPEQLVPGGGIDTRSDVYSLGILLYRLLAGCEAFSGQIGQTAQRKTEGPAPGPRRARKALPPECDWIVRKATDPSPSARYQTVDALAEDVSRLIDGRPILAHPPSWLYSARRAIKRRPLTALGIGASIAVVASLGTVVAVQAVRLSIRSRHLAESLDAITLERERAIRGERRQTELSRLLASAAMAASTDHRFVDTTDVNRVSALEGVVAKLTSEDDPSLVTELRFRYGLALRDARRWRDAEVQFAAAQATSDRIDEPSGERATRIILNRCRALATLGEHPAAFEIINKAIARAESGERTIHVAALYWERMYRLHALKYPWADTLACIEELHARCDEHPTRVAERLWSREQAGEIALSYGEVDLSERWFREALDLAMRHNRRSNDRSRLQYWVGELLVLRGRPSEGEPYLRAAAEYRAWSEGATGNRAHGYTLDHAKVLHRLKRFEEAVPRWETALIRPLAAGRPDQTAASQIRLGLAASRFAMGQDFLARTILALAVSRGETIDHAHPDHAAAIASVEAALRANDWGLDSTLESSLGDFKWLVRGILPRTVAPTPDAEPPD